MNKNFKLNIGGTDERDLEQAIQNSMNDQKEKENESKVPEPKEKPQPTYFSGQPVKFESSGKN